MHLVALPLLFGLLATIHAFPFIPWRSLPKTPPPRSSEFTLAMRMAWANDSYVPLTAIYVEDRGVLLRATNWIDGPGTPGEPPPSKTHTCLTILALVFSQMG